MDANQHSESAAQAPRFASPLEALRAAVAKIGSQSATGRLLGVSQHAVWQWLNKGKPLPAEHVLKVEEATGVSRHELRPDLYPIDAASAVSTIELRGTIGSCDRRSKSQGRLVLGEPAR